MTIKPLINQKTAEKDNNGRNVSNSAQDVVVVVDNNGQQQTAGSRRVVVNKSNVVESHGRQSPQRRGDVYEDITQRHRRSPNKSGPRPKRSVLAEHHHHHHHHHHNNNNLNIHHKQRHGGQDRSNDLKNFQQQQAQNTQQATLVAIDRTQQTQQQKSPKHSFNDYLNATGVPGSNSPKHSTVKNQQQQLPSILQQQQQQQNKKSPDRSATTTAATLKQIEETLNGYNSGDEYSVSKENSLTNEEWEKRDEQFIKSMLDERGFQVRTVDEDGACLFRSISLQIYGDQEMHEVIRQQTMDYIYQNREYFAHFVTEDINSYIQRKRNKYSHGNHIEVQAMSEIYNRPVELYCYQTTPINIFNAEQINNGYDPLRLSYQRGSHYNAILDPYNATVGVGLGLAGYKPESQTNEAMRLSEQLEIEQTMFEDKLKTTDWEATNEEIEEQIARESYLQWCRENMQRCGSEQQEEDYTTTTTATTIYGNSAGVANQASSSATVTSAEAAAGIAANNCQRVCSSTEPAAATIVSSKTTTVTTATSTAHNFITNKNCTVVASDFCNLTKPDENDSDATDMSSTSDQLATNYRIKYNSRRKNRNLKRKLKDNPDLNVGKRSKSLSPRHINESDLNFINDNYKYNINSINNNNTNINNNNLHNKNDVSPCSSKSDMKIFFNSSTSTSNFTTTSITNKPSTSSIHVDKFEPISTFYQSLLESSYTDDGYGQLTENEMIIKAIQMSRIDYINDQKIKYGLNYNVRPSKDDEDST